MPVQTGIGGGRVEHGLDLRVAETLCEVLEEHPAGIPVAVELAVPALRADAVHRPVRVQLKAAGRVIRPHRSPFGEALMQPLVGRPGCDSVLEEMKDLVRDDVITQTARNREMNLVDSGCNRFEDGVPAAQGRRVAERDGAVRDAASREVVYREISHVTRGGVSPADIEGVSTLCHAEDLPGLLLRNGCGWTRRDVAAPMDHEVIARERGDPGGGKRVDRGSPRHADGKRRRQGDQGKGQDEPRRTRHLGPDRLWPGIPLAAGQS